MGVTIHYSGTLRSWDRMPELQAIALHWAKHWKCEVDGVDIPDFELVRVRGGELEHYEGPVRGFVLRPHRDTEPLSILIGDDRYLCHSCKTQFAPPEAHIDIVAFLRDIQPYFEGFEARDEGGYWETGDRDELEKRLDFLNRAIDALAKALPEGSMAVDRTPRSGDN